MAFLLLVVVDEARIYEEALWLESSGYCDGGGNHLGLPLPHPNANDAPLLVHAPSAVRVPIAKKLLVFTERYYTEG
jgi:hypothetical protein